MGQFWYYGRPVTENTAQLWRDGRVVEGAALEMLFRGDFNEGSNPSLSVLKLKPSKAFKRDPTVWGSFLGDRFGGFGGF